MRLDDKIRIRRRIGDDEFEIEASRECAEHFYRLWLLEVKDLQPTIFYDDWLMKIKSDNSEDNKMEHPEQITATRKKAKEKQIQLLPFIDFISQFNLPIERNQSHRCLVAALYRSDVLGKNRITSEIMREIYSEAGIKVEGRPHEAMNRLASEKGYLYRFPKRDGRYIAYKITEAGRKNILRYKKKK